MQYENDIFPVQALGVNLRDHQPDFAPERILLGRNFIQDHVVNLRMRDGRFGEVTLENNF